MSRSVWGFEHTDVPCRECGAQPGELCKGLRGGETITHRCRVDRSNAEALVRQNERHQPRPAVVKSYTDRMPDDQAVRAMMIAGRRMDGTVAYPDPRPARHVPTPDAGPATERRAPKKKKADSPSVAIRTRVLERDGYECRLALAGVCTTRAVNVHHVRPKKAGGTNEMDNLLSSCRACHGYVHDNEQWAIAVGWLDLEPHGPAFTDVAAVPIEGVG